MNPTINAIIIIMIADIITVAMILNNPTLEMSLIVSLITKDSPKLSVFANLHFAINAANVNNMNIIMPRMLVIQFWKINPKTITIMVGMI